MTDALYAEVARLGGEGYAETSWELKQDGGETVLLVKDTSLLKTSADTVVDVFFDSVAALKATKSTRGGLGGEVILAVIAPKDADFSPLFKAPARTVPG